MPLQKLSSMLLKKLGCTVSDDLQENFTMSYLMECGLVGGAEASERRESWWKVRIFILMGSNFSSKLNDME